MLAIAVAFASLPFAAGVAAQSQESVLEEVIFTAQKRAETIGEIPQSIQVVGENLLLSPLSETLRNSSARLEAIRTATLNFAILMDDEAEWSPIEAGKRADSLIIDGRPDRNISDSRNIDTVILRGQALDRSALILIPETNPGFLHGTAVHSGLF